MTDAHSRTAARRALSFAWAVHASLKAEEEYAAMQINEIEKYLGLMMLEPVTQLSISLSPI